MSYGLHHIHHVLCLCFTNLSISYLVVGFLLIELICLPGLHHHIHHLWQWQWLSITIVFNLSAPLHQHPSAPHKRFKSITMFPSKLNIFPVLSKTMFSWKLNIVIDKNEKYSVFRKKFVWFLKKLFLWNTVIARNEKYSVF